MRNRRANGLGGPAWDDLPPAYRRDAHAADTRIDHTNSNSPEEVFGEIGLVLVIVLGIVLAINMVLVGLHIA